MKFTLDTDNKEFQDALNLIQYTRQSVFLTGKAGTGKSTFLKYVCEITKKKHIVLAPTGIAAINAGGSTLHSFFKLPFYPLLPDDPNFSLQGGKLQNFLKYSSAHKKLIKNVELIIIDEISMVRADIIDFIDKVLRTFRWKTNPVSRRCLSVGTGDKIRRAGNIEPLLSHSLFLLGKSIQRDGTRVH